MHYVPNKFIIGMSLSQGNTINRVASPSTAPYPDGPSSSFCLAGPSASFYPTRPSASFFLPVCQQLLHKDNSLFS